MKKSILFILSFVVFSINAQNKIQSCTEEYHDGSTWELSYGYDYEYDNNKNLIKEVSYNWNNNLWEKDAETTCSYNANNQIVQQTVEGWDMLGQFSNLERVNYTYDGNGLLNQMASQEWDGTQWQDYDRQIFSYNNGKLAKIDFEELVGQQWYSEMRYIFTYSGGVVTLITLEEFDGAQWDAYFKISFIYDSNNKKTNSIYEYFDGTVWEEFENINFDLDANLNLIKQSLFLSGTEEYYVDYSYDLADQLSNYAHPFDYLMGVDTLVQDFPYLNKILSYTGYELDGLSGTFYPSEKVTYNYNSQLVLNVENEKPAAQISLFPNPAVDFIEIKGITKAEKIVVIDVLGAVTFEKTVGANEKIYIEGLAKGLYLVKFKNGNTLKFVKK